MRRPRRAMAEINVVPYIDVMLVLLIIFMVAAPLINPGQIDLPEVGAKLDPAVAPMEIRVRPNDDLYFVDRARSPDELGDTGAAEGGAAALSAAVNCAGNNGKSNNPELLITIPEMRQIQLSGAPNLVLDARAERNLGNSNLRAQGALRIPPDHPVERLQELDVPRQTWLFAFCA